jgi:hypothetical protein
MLKSSNYKGAKLPTIAYTCGIIALRYFARDIPQSAALLFMIETTNPGMEATFLNTLALLSFQLPSGEK